MPRRVDPAPSPNLESLAGGGNGGGWTTHAWISPIPPDGPLTIFAEWPAYGISETSAPIDAGDLKRAAERIDELWPR